MPNRLEFSITGRPISKKNNRQLIRRGRMILSIPPKAFEPFAQSVALQLKPFLRGLDLPVFSTPVHIDYTFHMKGKLDTDCDNMQAGINDILQDAGVLANDKLIVEGTFKKIAGCKDWNTVLVVEEVKG